MCHTASRVIDATARVLPKAPKTEGWPAPVTSKKPFYGKLVFALKHPKQVFQELKEKASNSLYNFKESVKLTARKVTGIIIDAAASLGVMGKVTSICGAGGAAAGACFGAIGVAKTVTTIGAVTMFSTAAFAPAVTTGAVVGTGLGLYIGGKKAMDCFHKRRATRAHNEALFHPPAYNPNQGLATA